MSRVTIFFVVIDLRKESKTYLNKFTSHINADTYTSYFVPAGCANGWLTLTKNTLIHYTMFSRFESNHYSGFKYNDPLFSIDWPLEPKIISKKDLNWPYFVRS
jgi:dTDP-4-dehydrorhamnose 3,5-epimerase